MRRVDYRWLESGGFACFEPETDIDGYSRVGSMNSLVQLSWTIGETRMEEPFEEVITTRERLRELNKPPNQRMSKIAIDHIDDICRRFISACPFVVVASRGSDGRLALSLKGDPAGFVAVLAEKTLAIPDRLGNNRLDTFDNVLTYPDIGLFFIIPWWWIGISKAHPY